MAIVAGVDASTQSCTVELRDAESGHLLGSGRAPHPRTFPPVSEQDPEAWWDALQVAFAAAVVDANADSRDVRAISVAGQCHGLVMLDRNGSVLRTAKLWNDTVSAPQAERIIAELGGDAWARAVGSVPVPAYTLPKLVWMAEHEPEHLANLSTVLNPHDYLTYRLTGRFVTDRSEASGTCYYSAHEGRWRPDLLERFVAPLDWATMLPEVHGPEEAAGTVHTSAAAALGLAPGVVVGPGGGDQHLGAVGLGLDIGEVAYSLGTSGVVLTVSDTPVFDGSGAISGVANATGGWLPLVCTLNSTKVTDWTADLLGVDVAVLGEMALAVERKDRPVFAAFLDGERTPNRPGAQGVLAGLTTGTTREEVARAAFEGVLLGLVQGHARIQAAGASADGPVTVLGGGARSAAYRQILANMLGRDVAVRDAPESTARGAAIQAAAVLSGRSLADLAVELRPRSVSTTSPEAGFPEELRERYTTLVDWDALDR